MSDGGNSNWKFIVDVSQVVVAGCAVWAVTQTTQSVNVSRDSLALVKEQLKSEQDRHHEMRKWEIQPVVMFERRTSTLTATQDHPLDLSKLGEIGQIVNLGGGPAIALSVEWDFDLPASHRNHSKTTAVAPDILLPQGTAILDHLPAAFVDVKLSESQTIKGKVTLKCQDVDKHIVKRKQPFTLDVHWSEESKTSVITIEFKHLEVLDLSSWI